MECLCFQMATDTVWKNVLILHNFKTDLLFNNNFYKIIEILNSVLKEKNFKNFFMSYTRCMSVFVSVLKILFNLRRKQHFP